MVLRELNDLNYDSEITSLNRGIVLDFYAPGCAPCKKFAPIFEEMANKYNRDINFFKINAYQSPKTTGKFFICSVPTIVLLEEGAVCAIQSGVMSFADLEKLVLRKFDLGV